MTRIELDAKHYPVNAVTAFVDRAEVLRHFPNIELKAGQNEVVISKLPDVLGSRSIRVEGTGFATIFDVVYKAPSYVPFDPKDPTLVALERRKRSLSDTLRRLKKSLGVLDSFGSSLTGEHNGADAVAAFLDTYNTRAGALDAEIVEAETELAQVEEELREKKNKFQDDRREDRCGTTVTVVLLVKEDGPVALSLSYIVSSASWEPLYDLRAKASKDDGHSVDLHYRAEVRQSTGEDWKGVALTLSTASLAVGSAIPNLSPYKIDFAKPKPPAFKAKTSAPGDRLLRLAMIEHAPVAVRKSVTSVTFEVQGDSTVPSDGDAHKVSVAQLELDAELEWVVVPKEVERAFLQAKIVNNSPFPLLRGVAQVFLDGSFVATSDIRDVSPQEFFDVSLGADPALRVTYHPVSKRASTTSTLGWSKSTSTTFSQRITLTNSRASDALGRVLVRDQLPVSQDAQLKVLLREPAHIEDKQTALGEDVWVRWAKAQGETEAPQAWENSAGQEQGLIEWLLKLEGGASKTLKLEYEVQAPHGTAPWQKV